MRCSAPFATRAACGGAQILHRLDAWLGDLFTPERRDQTIDTLHRAGDDPATEAWRQSVTRKLWSCDDRLAKDRDAFEAGVDLATVSAWIAEVTVERTRHEIDLARLDGHTRLTKDQIAALVEQMADLAALFDQASPADRAEVYQLDPTLRTKTINAWS